MISWIKRKGVTLIELLIFGLIIAALSAIAIPRISKTADAAKHNREKPLNQKTDAKIGRQREQGHHQGSGETRQSRAKPKRHGVHLIGRDT